MGEAKRRREAKVAGKPWPEDLPKVYPHAGQYLGDDGEWHPNGDRYHRRQREVESIGMVAPPPESPSFAAIRAHIENRDDMRVVVVGKDPRSLPVRRDRPGVMELALLLAALGTEPIITMRAK